jgi:hypothetical protein
LRQCHFHDWHLEIFENPSDHAPQVGDPTPIICEITPRTEQSLYREGIRIQSLAGFFRLQDKRFQPTGHKAQKIRVTGYLMWTMTTTEAQTLAQQSSLSAPTDFIIHGARRRGKFIR